MTDIGRSQKLTMSTLCSGELKRSHLKTLWEKEKMLEPTMFPIHPRKNFCFYTFPKRQISDASKLKEFADDNFNFDENGRKFFEWVENTVGKRKIAPYEQYLLFPQYLQKTCTADT